jgi:hypothetical protein
VLDEITKTRDKYRYKVHFNGRLKGALGVTYKIEDTVEMDEVANLEEINLKLYDKYEHISLLTAERAWNCGYKNCQDRRWTLCALCYE